MGNPSYPPVIGPSPPGPPVSTRESMLAAHIAWLRHHPDRHVVIVTGGRDYEDRERVFAALDLAHSRRRITLLVHGACPTGADALADEWARERGVDVQRFDADWRALGPKAGPERNQRMVAAGATGAIAFPGGRGTEDCTMRCVAAGIKVWRPFG